MSMARLPMASLVLLKPSEEERDAEFQPCSKGSVHASRVQPCKGGAQYPCLASQHLSSHESKNGSFWSLDA